MPQYTYGAALEMIGRGGQSLFGGCNAQRRFRVGGFFSFVKIGLTCRCFIAFSFSVRNFWRWTHNLRIDRRMAKMQ